MPPKTNRSFLVGSETQTQEGKKAATGIERVIVETHNGLKDYLGIRGVDVAPIHTVDAPPSQNFMGDPYLATDRVLSTPRVKLSEIDGLMLLDLSRNLDFRVIRAERARRSLPVFALIHDILPITHPEWFPGLENRAYRLFLQQIFHISDEIVVTSEQVRADIQDLGWAHRAPIHVFPLGSIHRQRTPPTLQSGQISVLSVTTIAPRKGHELLLDAFQVLRGLGRDIDLTLVGRTSAAEKTVDRIRQHPDLGGRLKWFANADDHVVGSLAARCNVAVIPSEGEGFGMFLEEALTLGLKVVASDIPVFRERAQANVRFADLSAESFAHSLVMASEAPWEVGPHLPIRTMKDFARDFSDLVSQRLGIQ
jgi:glycosyltransferase involved in cell wall biosynthesis